jgi:hypothetical protein
MKYFLFLPYWEKKLSLFSSKSLPGKDLEESPNYIAQPKLV